LGRCSPAAFGFNNLIALDKRLHSYEIDWDLNCSYEEAIELLTKNIDTRTNAWGSDVGHIKGKINYNKFTLWYRSGGMRSFGEIAIGECYVMKYIDRINLKCTFSISRFLRLFSFPKWLTISIYIVTFLMWVLYIYFFFFPTDSYSAISWLSAVFMLVSINIVFRNIAAYEMGELIKFTERLFSTCRIIETITEHATGGDAKSMRPTV